jgi:hypothetical protein
MIPKSGHRFSHEIMLQKESENPWEWSSDAMTWLKRHESLIAAAVIMIAVTAGWLLMPRLMLLVSGGGPLVGAAVAVAFMLAFFAVLWLRARHQRRVGRN